MKVAAGPGSQPLSWDDSGPLQKGVEIWRERHHAHIVIVLSLVFGTWFLLVGLSWLDVI